MIQQEIVIIAFVCLVALCVQPRYYFLLLLAVLAAAFMIKPVKKSEFVSLVGTNLDSSDDLEAIMSRAVPITDGDDLIHEQMRHVGGQAKDAILARARYNSETVKNLYEEELDIGEQRDWWEDDSLIAKTVKDGVAME